MRRLLVLLAGSVLVALLPFADTWGATPNKPDCRVPPEIVQDEPRLPELARRLHEKRPITIVAIGGASTAGTIAGNTAEEAYPRRLQDVLRHRYPSVPITVINKGVARDTTQQMVSRFPDDVYSFAPSLVIWETGNFDASRSMDVDTFANALEAGLTDLHEHKLEIMLIDMQYSRGTASVINFEPYLEALWHTADVEGVYVFRRFEMMKYWSENGVFNFVDVPKERRTQLAGEVYECLAERLAEAIEYATR